MIQLDIPGCGTLRIAHLVSNVNGTNAKDGRLLDKMAKPLAALRDHVTIHLLTADTNGRQDNIELMLGLKAIRIQPGDEAQQKAAYVQRLGAETVMAIGQGANDAEMLRAAAIGVAILSDEGLAGAALQSADLVMGSIHAGLNLLEVPTRLIARLRR